MLTLFSIPKPFVGHVGVIQRNALASWTRLGEDVQVILLGDEAGIAEAAREFGAEHVPDIERTKYGTPLVNSAFGAAGRSARHQLLCYVNGDIMFTDELTRAAGATRKRDFLMVGRRWNVDITDPWDFSDAQWGKKLLTFTHGTGSLYRHDAIDYFVFPRNSKLIDLPPFAVGRPRWDNYFLFRCRELGYPLIDATGVVTAVHQNHDYTHVPEGTGPPHLSFSPEGDANMKLLGDERRRFDILDATHKLTKSGLRRTTGPEYWRRYRSRYPVLHPRQEVLVNTVKGIRNMFRRIGLFSTYHESPKESSERGSDH
jgi:hypothetical protein